MQFQRVNRDTPEKVYVLVQNIQGATITTGYPVNYAIGASMDGISAQITNSATLQPGFVGVAVNDIANNDFGRVQIGGFVNSMLISNFGTSVTINVGDPLIPGGAGFASGAPTFANSGLRWAYASNVPVAVSAGGYVSGFLRMP